MKNLSGSFLDILPEKEKQYYLNYHTGDVQTPYDVAKFKAVWIKKVRYNKSRKWIRKLARRIVKDVDPSAEQQARSVLYSAYVWGKTH